MVKAIEKMALGNFSQEILVDQEDEIGELATSLKNLQNSIVQKALIIEQISEGNFSQKAQPLGHGDQLSKAVNGVIDNFKNVIAQATLIAQGEFNIKVTPKSNDDDLGKALKLMGNKLNEISQLANTVSKGDFSVEIPPSSSRDEISFAMNEMTRSLRQLNEETKGQVWLKSGQNGLNSLMQGDQPSTVLSNDIIQYISKYINAQVGTFFLAEHDSTLKLIGSYSYNRRKNLSNTYKKGDGLVGQAMLEKQIIIVSNIPDNYMDIRSALGEAKPKNIAVVPCIHNDMVIAVFEVGSFETFTDLQVELLKQMSQTIAVRLNSSKNKEELEVMFEKSKNQAEELKTQQRELEDSNNELRVKQEELKTSEERLKSQQEELRVINEELEEKTESLEKQKNIIFRRNLDLEQVQKDLQKKAKELEISSKYKSEFLANMSHELRTPLNSLLILSQNLKENKEQNLTKEQIQSSHIIHDCGAELLELINEILDLSKIESGKMELKPEKIPLTEIIDAVNMGFLHVAKDKGVEFKAQISDDIPDMIFSDRQKIHQLLKNLISNALKFTRKGSVTLTLKKPEDETAFKNCNLSVKNTIAFAVKDTGIGIPKDKQLEIFEAFQQIDGGTSRKFGGTGLGLSISRELSQLLEGEIQLHSEVGKGAEFILYLPYTLKNTSGTPKTREITTSHPEESHPINLSPVDSDETLSIPDDHNLIEKNDQVILVVEDDPKFAHLLKAYCHEKGYKFLHSMNGEQGIELAEKFLPDAIILDIKLPGVNGWTVLNALKSNTKTRHLPVHMMSVEEKTIDACQKGAIGYLTKPVSKKNLEIAFQKIEMFNAKRVKDLLIIEDNKEFCDNIVKLIGNRDVVSKAVHTGMDALQEIRTKNYDCIILDLELEDISGFELLKKLKTLKDVKIPPVIIYTGKDISQEEEYELSRYADSIIIRGVKSEERLLDETSLFLHRVVSNLPERKRQIINNLHGKHEILKGKKILLADDDMRNVYAISKVLADKDVNVLKASDGQKALDLLTINPDVDLVLMDIMMPNMDGYEAITKIREQSRFQKLPIITLTAKAMKEDRERSIEVGANDYMTKPIKIERLLSLLRVWLYQ